MCDLCPNPKRLAIRVNSVDLCYECIEFFRNLARSDNRSLADEIERQTLYINQTKDFCNGCQSTDHNGIAYDFWVKDGVKVDSSVPGAKHLGICFDCDDKGFFICAPCETVHKHEVFCSVWSAGAYRHNLVRHNRLSQIGLKTA